MGERVQVLDKGYAERIEHWGSDERIIESARMSTGKGFQGWDPRPCDNGCIDWTEGIHMVPVRYTARQGEEFQRCPKCKGSGMMPGDEKLLRYLYTETPKH